MQKLLKKSSQVNEIKKVTETPPRVDIFKRNIKYLKLKDVKRAYSKLIQDFCNGKVANEDARVLVYLFTGYLQLIRDMEIDERLQIIEEKLSEVK